MADVVYISSGPYTFKLDKQERHGMMTPIWTDRYQVLPGLTSFYLQLAQDGQQLVADLEGIKPTLLLFLRQLVSFTIEIAINNIKNVVRINQYDTDDPDVFEVERLFNGNVVFSEKYLKLKHTIEPYQHEEKRQNIAESDVILAFPITENGSPIIRMQEVHAFLPVRSCGFSVRFPVVGWL